MAEPSPFGVGGPPQHANYNHVSLTILNTLTSMDNRLKRLETVLQGLSEHTNNTHSSIDNRLKRIESAMGLSDHQHHNTNHNTHNNGNVPPPPAPMQPLPPSQQPMVMTTQNGPTGMGPGHGIIHPLEAPPQGYTISSRATMQEELDQWTIPRGYSMRIAGAKVSGKRKVRWVCFRGGEARHHRPPVDQEIIEKARAEGRRKPTTDRTSKKCGCLFKFEVVETVKGSDVWVLHYPNDEHKVHNHGPSDQKSDPRARKLPPFMSAEVDQWLRDGWLVSKIQEELKKRGFQYVLNTDLYNRKRLLKKDEPSMIG